MQEGEDVRTILKELDLKSPRYGCSAYLTPSSTTVSVKLVLSMALPPPPPRDPASVHNMWSNLQQILNISGTIEDYNLADDAAETPAQLRQK